MAVARELTTASLPTIARAFARSSHTTALSAIRRGEALCERHPEYRASRRRVLEALRARFG